MERFSREQWNVYYDAMKDLPPRDTALLALANFDKEGLPPPPPPEHRLALDLGCGEGRDTVELLRRGWRVEAMDAQEEGLFRLRNRPDIALLASPSSLKTACCTFEELAANRALWPAQPALLINASFSLPFCSAAAFPALWEKLSASLAPGGRFCGQLFGDRDGWADDKRVTNHTRAQAEDLLKGFRLEHFEEFEGDGQTAGGTPKYWHVFHIVAKK